MAKKQNLKGWIRQRPDPRDQFFYPAARLLRSLPTVGDLTSGMGPLLNQDQLGACGPHSIAELISFDEGAEKLVVKTPSRLHIYWWTRFLMGTTDSDSGVDNRTMLKALSKYGQVPDESLWPYDESKYTEKPPVSVNTVGLHNRVTKYAAVTQSLTQMQGTIVSGHPFLFGFDVYSQMMSDEAAKTGIVTDPPSGATPEGGHDVSFVGFNASGKDLPGLKEGNKWPSGYWRFRNHWVNDDGTPWGDMGYGYISFGYSTGPNASDFWVINYVTANEKSFESADVGKLNWQVILAEIKAILGKYGPAAVPIIEALVAKLPLSPAQLAVIDALIQSVLGGGK